MSLPAYLLAIAVAGGALIGALVALEIVYKARQRRRARAFCARGDFANSWNNRPE